MPEISRFYGIVIRMYFDDHLPRHFHALYAGTEAVIDIDTLALLSGRIPPRALGMVTEWALLHQNELRELWDQARDLAPLHRIDPLP